MRDRVGYRPFTSSWMRVSSKSSQFYHTNTQAQGKSTSLQPLNRILITNYIRFYFHSRSLNMLGHERMWVQSSSQLCIPLTRVSIDLQRGS